MKCIVSISEWYPVAILDATRASDPNGQNVDGSLVKRYNEAMAAVLDVQRELLQKYCGYDDKHRPNYLSGRFHACFGTTILL